MVLRPAKINLAFVFCFMLVFTTCSSFESYLEKFSDDGGRRAANAETQEGQERQERQGRRNRNENAQEQTTNPANETFLYEVPFVDDGFIRLILNEKTSSFSLLYHQGNHPASYQPLFSNSDPRTSYLSVSVNDKIHHLGRSRIFNTEIERINGDPALVFKSSFLTVSKIFSPVMTISSENINGVMISIIIENTSDDDLTVGLRFLIDTELGEGIRSIPFYTDNRIIRNEFLLDDTLHDKYWVSPGEHISLMGSIENPVNNTINVNVIRPCSILFANWKRIHDAPWKPRFMEGRSFTYFPSSIRDSAVCYFYEPDILEGARNFVYVIFLTTEDTQWHIPGAVVNVNRQQPAQVAVHNAPDQELSDLVRLREILDQFVAGLIELTERDLIEIEKLIDTHRN